MYAVTVCQLKTKAGKEKVESISYGLCFFFPALLSLSGTQQAHVRRKGRM
jgi:hypothetical protein